MATVPEVYVEGDVRVHQANIPYLAGMLGMSSLSAFPAAPAQLIARMRVLPREAGYDVVATEWRVGIADLSLHGNASLMGLGTAGRRLSATLSASSMPIKLLLDQLAAEWLPPGFRDRLADHAVDGLVTVYDTHLEGLLSEKPRFTVTGGIEIRNGRFSLGASHPVIRDLAATVVYDLEQVRITGFRANYGPVRLADGTALITDWRAEPMADVRISAEARAIDVIALVNDGNAFPQFENALAPLEQISGDVLMSAHLSGRPAKGEMSLVETVVAIHNFGFRHQAVTMPFSEFEASLRLSPTEIRLDHLQGQAGPAMIEAAGRVGLAGQPFFDGLLLNAVVEGQDLAPYIHATGNGAVSSRLAGPILLRAAITGAVGTPRFKGTLTLDGAALEIPNLFTKAAGSPAGLRFDGELTADRVLSIRRGELVSPPVRLTGEGHIQLHDAMDFEARLVSEAMSLEQFPPGVSLGPIRAGILKAGLRVRGRAADRASWLASGRLRFDKGTLSIEQLSHSIKDLSLGLRFDGKSIDIRRLTFMLGESDVRVSGTITNWMDAPRAKLLVESSQIDAQTLEVKGQGGSPDSDAFSVLPSWGANGNLEATLLIDHVYYERFLLTGFSCRVRMEQGLITIDRISADTNDGHLGGRVVLNMPDRGHATARSTFRASGIPVERVLSLIEGGPRMTGWMSATGRMQAEFERKRLLRASINSRRPISLILEDGRIFHVPVLAKLLAIMNLPALLEGKIDLTKAGMPVDRLKAVFSVEDGIIKIKEFLLDSPILKISGAGRYDFIEDQFDAVLVTSPLGQYSALLKSIPLFGKLFAGERQGFDTAIFEVKGPAKDPSVVYLPAESLMAGVKGTAQLAVDLLVNAITLPKEAFSMAEDLFSEDDES